VLSYFSLKFGQTADKQSINTLPQEGKTAYENILTTETKGNNANISPPFLFSLRKLPDKLLGPASTLSPPPLNLTSSLYFKEN